MSRHVFTYGSLMFAPVWEQVVTGRYRGVAATLAGYRRFALLGETYPGMVREPSGSVSGVLYFDVSEADLAALDHFEGNEYERCSVGLRLGDASHVSGDTYVFTALERLSDQPWEPENFALQRFIGSYCRDKLSD